jgi:hypothetical protein
MCKAIAVILIFLSRFDLALANSDDIYSTKVLKQTEESVLFEVSYYYSGEHGDNAKLTAWPKPAGFWGSSIIPLVIGHHTSQLNVKLMPNAPKDVLSDSIEFFYYSDNGPPFYTKVFTFKKKWVNSTGKPATSPKQFERK